MTKIDKWREKQVFEKGATQYKAEANLDKQLKSDTVEMYESSTGQRRQYKKPVADILKQKREVESIKLMFVIPDLSHIDWSK